MICPLCGKEISYLWLYKDAEADIAYKVTESEMTINSVAVYYEKEVSAETPCCKRILSIDEHDVKEIMSGKSLLLPVENIPDPLLIDNTYYYCIKYNGKLYLAEGHFTSLRTVYTQDKQEMGDLMLFREIEKFKKINGLKLQRLKQIAKRITREELVVAQEVMEE